MKKTEITLPLSGQRGGEWFGVSYLVNLPTHTGASGFEVTVWCPLGYVSVDCWQYKS